MIWGTPIFGNTHIMDWRNGEAKSEFGDDFSASFSWIVIGWRVFSV